MNLSFLGFVIQQLTLAITLIHARMTANAMWQMITVSSASVQFLKLTLELIVVPKVSSVVHHFHISHFLHWLNFKCTKKLVICYKNPSGLFSNVQLVFCSKKNPSCAISKCTGEIFTTKNVVQRKLSHYSFTLIRYTIPDSK